MDIFIQNISPFILAFLMLIVLFSLVYLIYSIIIFLITGVPFVPTPKKYFKILFKEIGLKDSDVVYDLGCGTGIFLFAAKKAGVKNLIGYELSPALVLIAKVLNWFKRTKVRFVCGNFMKADISDATFIYLFLVGPVLPKVWEKIKKETKTGTIVVSLSSPIPGIEYFKKIKTNPKKKKSSFFYFYKT
jgi:SAM-dependent methyltransferase